MRNIIFEDKDGYNYNYNDDTGVIYQLPGDVAKNISMRDIIVKSNEDQINQMNQYIDYLIDVNKLNGNVDFDKEYLDRISPLSLTFKLTEKCNMRCKYCTYSDHYKYTLPYSDKGLDFETAKKAVDMYMKLFAQNSNKNIRKAPYFTFYGGEPLIGYNVMVEIVEYINVKYGEYKPNFLITTNGLLLNSDRAKFLKENNFYVSISVDGYKENHDRNRVTINNEKTYDIVKDMIRKYFLNYDKMNIFMCFDIKTDFDELINSGKNDDIDRYILSRIVKITPISNQYTDYYDGFSVEEKMDYRKRLKKMNNEYIERVIKSEEASDISKILFEYDMILIYDRQKYTFDSGYYKVPRGLCLPGDKLFLLPDGSLTLCEKVASCDSFIIGNVNTGLEYTKIENLINKMNKISTECCENCNISKLCYLCYSSANIKDENFLLSDTICNNIREDMCRKMADFVYVNKKNKSYLRNYFVKRFSDRKDKIYEVKNVDL